MKISPCCNSTTCHKIVTIFVHATTAQLRCNVQNFVAIMFLESKWEQIEIKFNRIWICDRKPFGKSAPGHMRMVSANGRRRYICNILSRCLRLSRDMRQQKRGEQTFYLRIFAFETLGCSCWVTVALGKVHPPGHPLCPATHSRVNTYISRPMYCYCSNVIADIFRIADGLGIPIQTCNNSKPSCLSEGGWVVDQTGNIGGNLSNNCRFQTRTNHVVIRRVHSARFASSPPELLFIQAEMFWYPHPWTPFVLQPGAKQTKSPLIPALCSPLEYFSFYSMAN